MKMCSISVTIVIVAALFALQPQAVEKPADGKVERWITNFIDVHGAVFYAALYALPETQGSFIKAVGDGGWGSHAPSDLAAQLSAEQKQKIVAGVVKTLNEMRDEDSTQYFKRIGNWLIAYDQLDVCMRLTSLEQTMAAAYAVPLTRPLFDSIIKNRRFDPESVSAAMVGATLASGEAAGITYALLNKLSTLSRREQVRYFRDLYNSVLQVMEICKDGEFRGMAEKAVPRRR